MHWSQATTDALILPITAHSPEFHWTSRLSFFASPVRGKLQQQHRMNELTLPSCLTVQLHLGFSGLLLRQPIARETANSIPRVLGSEFLACPLIASC